jgi:hypothetical protein
MSSCTAHEVTLNIPLQGKNVGIGSITNPIIPPLSFPWDPSTSYDRSHLICNQLDDRIDCTPFELYPGKTMPKTMYCQTVDDQRTVCFDKETDCNNFNKS